MMRQIFDLGNGYAELVKKFPDFVEFQKAALGIHGNGVRLVVADKPELYFVRLVNGGIIKAYHDDVVSPVFDLLVIVGRQKDIPYRKRGEWHICGLVKPFLSLFHRNG